MSLKIFLPRFLNRKWVKVKKLSSSLLFYLFQALTVYEIACESVVIEEYTSFATPQDAMNGFYEHFYLLKAVNGITSAETRVDSINTILSKYSSNVYLDGKEDVVKDTHSSESSLSNLFAIVEMRTCKSIIRSS